MDGPAIVERGSFGDGCGGFADAVVVVAAAVVVAVVLGV